MEEEDASEARSLFDGVKPPRIEDAGLEDCALPPESIREAFMKAAFAVGSLISASDDEDESGSEEDQRNKNESVAAHSAATEVERRSVSLPEEDGLKTTRAIFGNKVGEEAMVQNES